MSQGGKDQFERASDQALAWIARLNSESVRDEDRQAFALWLAADPLHREAMDGMLDLWDDLGCLQEMHVMPEAANAPSWWQAGIAAAACLVLALFLWPLLVGEDVQSLEYRTALGESIMVRATIDSASW